jgi:ABC-2 type transport system permease protein
MSTSDLATKPVVIHTGRKRAASFIVDVLRGASMVNVWRTFAMDDIRQRYRRSVLGLLWIILSFATFVAAITFFFGAFTRASPSEFVTHVAIGFAVYSFLTANIIDGCQVFVNAKSWIKSVSLPFSIHVYRSIFRSLFTFSLNLAVALIAMIVFGWRPELVALLCFPAVVIYLFNAVAAQYLLGLVAARYRDVGHLVASIMRIMIFVTPILWVREERSGMRAVVADLNPLAHYIEIFRAPLLGVEPRMVSWLVVLGFTLAIWGATVIAGTHMRSRVAYWV